MAVSTLDQFHLFLLALAGGAFAGLFFDLFRAIRRLVQSGVVWVSVQDLIFWLFSAISVFLFLYHFNAGQLRWYIFCGMGLGGLFYHLLFGDRLVRLLSAFFHLVSAFYAILSASFLCPSSFSGGYSVRFFSFSVGFSKLFAGNLYFLGATHENGEKN